MKKPQLQHLPIDDLLPYARNSKTHPPEQIAQIAASIKEFGFNAPVLVDGEKGIIAGHGRVLAARKLGLATVPCVVLDHLTEAQKRAYIIADNRLGDTDLAPWDWEMLQAEIDALKEENYDYTVTGFTDESLAAAIEAAHAGLQPESTENSGADTEPQIDRAEELRVKWGVEYLDLWICGEHRLLCGDSTKAEDVGRLMAGEKADLCFTSPPYGQQRDYRDGATEKGSDWDTLMKGVFGNLPMSEAGQVLVNLGLIHRDNEWLPYWDGWIQWMRQQGWRRFGWYVWDQGWGLPGDWNGRFAPSHEFVFHFNKSANRPAKSVETLPASQKKGKQSKDRLANGEFVPSMRDKDGNVKIMSSADSLGQAEKIPDSIIRIPRAAANDIARKNHPAIFPIELPELIIKSWPGLIYEPFSGSGTTIIAGENLKRKVRAMEISPAYVAVALERFHQHTGIMPIRA